MAVGRTSLTRSYDGLGRQTTTNTNGVLVTSTFDAYGRALTQSTPHTSGEPAFYTTTTYDALGRAITTAAPDGMTTTNVYDGLSTTVTDANAHSTTSVTDVLGRTLSVTPPTGPSVAFEYDALGNLLTASRGGATVSLTYDVAGRKIAMNDPDMGNWTYAYDALGAMTSQTDARGCVTNLDYDLLGRPLTKTYSNCPSTPTVTYGYDAGTNGKGRRTSVSDGSGLTVLTYDIRGRVTTEAKQIDSNQFSTSFAYNSADLPVSMTYPDGEVLNFTYNNQMMLTSVLGTDSYLQSVAYDSAGRITHRVLGANKITSNFNYYAWNTPNGAGRLQSAVHTNSTLTLQTFSYTYDPIGNIMGINDTLSGETQSFAYDALDRLTSASATAGLGNYSESYGYNATTGNLETKGNLALQYADLGHVHAVTSAGGNSYQYDANGNQTTRIIGADTFTLSYDAENRLTEVKKNGSTIAQFTYDGDGKRVKSVIGSETILFVGGHYEKQGTNVTKYYLASAQRIAVRKNGTLSYLLGDHLGSTSITTDANGNRVSEMRYKAWGEVRFTEGVIPTKYSFTGQYSNVDDFGLLFYNARFFDPALGRFSSADIVLPNGSQGFDRYNYVNNRPTVNTDPTGHMPSEGDGGNSSCLEGTTDKRDLTDWGSRALVDSANDHRIQYQAAINSVPHLTGSWPQMLPAYTELTPIVANGAYYDVKWNIQRTVGPEQPVRLGSYWYEFSTPGNILFGFYGHAAGYSLGALSFGAGYAQRHDYKIGLTDDLGPWWPPFYSDTEDDHYAVEFGYELYDQYLENGGLSSADFTTALDNFSHRAEMATEPAPSDCRPASTPYSTNAFYNP